MKFKNYTVPGYLKDVVDHIYLNEHDKREDVNMALPNIRMCLIFTYKLKGTLFEQNMVTNEITKSHEIALGGFIPQRMKYFTKEKFHAVIVGLTPWAKYLLKDLNGEFYLNENIELESVYPKLMSDLKEQLNDDVTDDEKVVLVLNFLKKIFTHREVNPRVKQAIGIITKSRGRIKIEDLSNEVAYSKRQLNRLFKSQIGISPKELSKIYTVQHSIAMIKNASLPMASVAHDGGYFDQTHFIKTFKSLCGITPDAFKKILPSQLSTLATKKLKVGYTSLYM